MSSAPSESGYEVLPHPADIGIRFWGKTLSDAFCAAAKGLTFLLCGSSELSGTYEVQVALEGEDREDLLFVWLSELLYRFDAEGLLLAGCDVHAVSDRAISATLRCAAITPDSLPVPYYVKAVTFHQMALEPEDGGWNGRVYFDI